MKTTCLIVALFAAFGAAQAAKDEHPIEKVVSMLQGLSAKAEAEGKEEALAYEKYEYFVKNSVKELSGAIAQEKSDIEELTDLIDSKEKAKEVLTGQIADLTQELSDLDVEMKGAKNNRQDAEDIYDDKSAALKLTIEGCQQCLTLLSTSKDATDTGLLQQKVSALVPLLAAKASKQQLALLQEFGRPDQLASGDRTSHEKGYAFKSGSVVELLKGLEAKFSEELLETEKSETNSVNAFELANAARQDLIDAASASKEAKTKELGEVEGALAEAQGTKEDTEGDLAADSTTLKDTKKAANMKASEWAERSKTRSNELEAIKVAIGILAKVSGVRTEAPENPVPPPSPVAFLEMRSVSADPKMKAVELIRQAAKVGNSRALEQLATEVAAHLTGPFDKVNNMIEKMIFRLMDEQKNEDEHKHWCDKEITNTELMIKEKTEKSEDADSTITQLTEKIQNLKNGINDNQNFVATTEDEIASRTEDRAADKKENEATIKDAEDAQTAIANAIAVLETFYKESGEVAKEAWEAFAQTKAVSHRMEPEPELWAEEEYTGTEGGPGLSACSRTARRTSRRWSRRHGPTRRRTRTSSTNSSLRRRWTRRRGPRTRR